MSQGLYICIKIKMMLNGFVVVCDYPTELKKKNVRRDICIYLQLVQKKTGNCQNKIDTFLELVHSVKPSY
jgi:hypothetical protein